MRRTALALNTAVVVFFVSFLAYTFFARQHLDSLARGFVTEKTLSYSRPVVELTETMLDLPLVQKILSRDQQAAIRHEIVDYQNDPAAYIADLTQQPRRAVPKANANPLIEKVTELKAKIRRYYDNTLNALIADLRMFSISNLIAGLIAWNMAYCSSSDIRKPIVWFSWLMFVAVVYCSYLYVDDLTFFRILFRTHMGWWYPVLLCVMLAALYFDYGRPPNATEQSHPHEAADSRLNGDGR